MKQNDENRVVIKDGKVVTIFNEEARCNGYVDIEEGRRLIKERLKLFYNLLNK